MAEIKKYCINLDRRPYRWANAQVQFAIHGLQVERFSAIDGHAIPGKESLTLKPGLYGCTVSHYLLIQRAMYLHLDIIMVFEDDVVLHDDFNKKLEQLLEDLPRDWEMVMLGGSHREPPEKVAWVNYYRCNKTLTSHGYIIKSSVYQTVLDKSRAMQEPIDCVFAEIQKNGNVYIPEPPLAWQAAGFSDIENREMDYPWIKSNNQ